MEVDELDELEESKLHLDEEDLVIEESDDVYRQGIRSEMLDRTNNSMLGTSLNDLDSDDSWFFEAVMDLEGDLGKLIDMDYINQRLVLVF